MNDLRSLEDMRKKISVFLAAKEKPTSGGAKRRLRQVRSIYIAGEASSKEEVLKAARENCPDVILLDGPIPELQTPSAIRQLREICPDLKLMILSGSDDPTVVLPALRNGIEGYILNNLGPAELVDAIESVMDGGAYFSPAVSRLLLNEYLLSTKKTVSKSDVKLSPREKQVLHHIVNGRTNKETASELGLGVRTIETHRERVMKKLNARNSAELTKIAVTTNLLNAG